jgi:hypothetical protein
MMGERDAPSGASKMQLNTQREMCIMQEETLDNLVQRMNRLEREVRHWRLGATMLLTCAVAVLVMGQTLLKPQVIEGQRFILKSPDGTIRAILGQHDFTRKAPPTGEPQDYTKSSGLGTWGLHIFGSDGEYVAGLMSSYYSGGGSLMLNDKETASSAEFSVGHSYANLVLRAETRSRETSEWQWREFHKKREGAKTPKEKAEAYAIMPVEDSSVHIFVGASKDTPTALKLSEKGRDKVVLGSIDLSKPHGVVERRPLSSLVFSDKDGKVIWKAP